MPRDPHPSASPASRRGPSPLALLRLAVLTVGMAAGVLLVRALDHGLRDAAVELGPGHVVFGMLVGLVVMPGPLMAFFVGPGHGDRARGLVFGGCVVTMFAGLLGGAMLWHRMFGDPAHTATATEWTALAWCALALPVAAVDAARLRFGAGTGDAASDDAGDPE